MSSGLDVLLHAFPGPTAVEGARRAEAAGFDGLLFADSQSLVPEVWVQAAAAAAATTTLRVGPGVTNPVTRHVAVTASAAATLQMTSGRRALLSVGRGDSSLNQVGLTAPGPSALETWVRRARALLGGHEVELDDGTVARLAWLAPGAAPPVEVDVAATGPHAIGAGARAGDRVSFTVGGDPAAVEAAIGLARSAAGAVDRGGRELGLGAWVNIAVDPDPAVARELVRGSAAIFARFGATARGATTAATSAAAAYARDEHGLTHGAAARTLPDTFIDAFAIAGAPEDCARRLGALADLGLDRLVLVHASRDADPVRSAASLDLLAREVLPALRKTRPPDA